MAINRKATMAKRQRELEQKDRVKDRESRRAERKARSEARIAAGESGPEMGEPPVVESTDPAPVATTPDTLPPSRDDGV
jgi:hypothetical protein